MYPAMPEVAFPVWSLRCPDVPLLPASAVEMEISPEDDSWEAPLAISMLPPVALTGLNGVLIEGVAVVDPEVILTLPPSPESPVPTLR